MTLQKVLINEFGEISILKQVITHLDTDYENPMAETQFEEVWAGGMRIVGKSDVVVVNTGDGTGGKYECVVKSETDSDLWYHVRQTAQKGWTCSCPLYREGRKICKHITAAFIHLSTKESKGSESDSSSDDINLKLPPPRWCLHCGSVNCTIKEERVLQKMTRAKKEDGKNSVICRCNSCSRTFADRLGFVGRHYSEKVILKVLILVARHTSPKDAARTANEDYKTNVDERTARRWVKDYSYMISAYTNGLKVSGVTAVAVDEKCYFSGGVKRYVYTGTCLKSRLTLAVCHSFEKLSYDATPLFEAILEKITIPPLLMIADGLNGYKTGNKNVFKTDPPTTMYIQDASVNGVHTNNSIEERSNGYLQECIRGARGFNSDEPGRITLGIIYRDFVRPHMGIDNMTPAEKAGIHIPCAEKAGIHIPGIDKMLALIRCAAASRLNFT